MRNNHTQVQQLNQNLLNQEAKQLLVQAEVDVDPSYQHLYQLLLWGLDQGLRFWHQHRNHDDHLMLLEQVAYHLDQEMAYRYLVNNPELEDEDEALLSPGDLESSRSPLEAARKLVEAFQAAVLLNQDSFWVEE